MLSYYELKRHILSESAKKKIPVGGEFELTGKCNLQCKMCFVQDERISPLSTEQWKKIFDDAYKHGLVYALLTGGEVLTRSDFLELYNYLYDLGVRITVYTNGTLITEKIAQAFQMRPPEMVGITLYGSNNQIYEQVTGNNNGFTLVNRGIDILQKYKINLFVRTIPIKPIMEDLDNIMAYVKQKKLPMQYSLYVGPSRVKSGSEYGERLNPKQLLEYEKKMIDTIGRANNREFRYSTNGFTCIALKSAYFITAQGRMQPCAMLIHPSKSVVSNDFFEVWNELSKLIDKINGCRSCSVCKYNTHCVQCPAKLYLEGGFTKCSKYLHDIAKLRKANI